MAAHTKRNSKFLWKFLLLLHLILQRSDDLKNSKEEGVNHDKWIVLTTVASPTEDVKFLANISGWKVVVVGDTKTPKDWSYPNCVYLSVKKQLELGLKLPQYLPYKHYARKNVGYLYAIAHGATVIYETDDDNRPLDKLTSFELKYSTSALMYSGPSVPSFNPYRHFGQPTLWPRGFPLSHVGSEPTDEYRLSGKWPTPAIQQGVVNGDPDMDALFRLTRKKTLTPLRVKFDPAAPPVILPPGVFSPFNSQNTLFHEQAFWALLIPTTTNFRVCDIWRGYWAQRLLWEIAGHLGFYPPNAYQQRNAHSYLADMEDEDPMYHNTERLLSFLSLWICPHHLTFFQCVYKLSFEMAQEGFWLEGDVLITKNWLEDLIRIRYPEPKRVVLTRQDTELSGNGDETVILKQRQHWLSHGTRAKFSAAVQTPPDISSSNLNKDPSPISKHITLVGKHCPSIPSLLISNKAITSSTLHFKDVLLVIVFNWPLYTNVRFTETVYRPLFPNIVYCGANGKKFAMDTSPFSDQGFSFIEVPHIYGGQFGQMCLIKAMQVNYNVTGYLVTGEDVLMNVWNFRNFDKNKIWMSLDHKILNMEEIANWMWWPRPTGSKAYSASMATLNSLSNIEIAHNKDQSQRASSNVTIGMHKKGKGGEKEAFHLVDHIQQKPSAFLARLRANMNGRNTVVHGVSDVYYIPSRLRRDVLFYFTLFTNHELFVELCVPITIFGLEKHSNLEFFASTNLYLGDRSDPWRHFDIQKHTLHPVKFSEQKNLGPFCNTYLPILVAKSHEQVY